MIFRYDSLFMFRNGVFTRLQCYFCGSKMETMTLKDKRILLTGATSGIGRDLAIMLAEQGAHLALCGRSEDKMQTLINDLSIDGGKIVTDTFSVTNEQHIIHFVAKASLELGGIDFVINNAGLNSARANVADILTDDFDHMVAVNLRAPFIFMREAYKAMQPQQNGMIVNVLSTACLYSNEGIGAYTASKSGLEALTKVFRKEARKDGIKVCSIYPGGTDTPFRSNDRPDYMTSKSVAKTILSMLMLPDDVVMHDVVFRPMIESNF